MTPLQRKQLAQILLKEGEEGWRVERQYANLWRENEREHTIDCVLWRYRAVRIERTPTRTPLPIEHYKRGMEVKNECEVAALVVERCLDGSLEIAWKGQSSSVIKKTNHFVAWRWPNETEWKPAYIETVEERVVQTLIVEGL